MKLHELIANARRQSGFSLRELEAETGISNPLLSQIETGHIKEPSFRKIIKIGMALKIPLKKMAEAQ